MEMEESKDFTLTESIENAVKQLKRLESSLKKDKINSEQLKNLMFLDKFNLLKTLDAIVYKAKIDNKICNFNKIIEGIKLGYDKLKCTQPKWNKKAVMYLKADEDGLADLFCQKHSKSVDPFIEGQHELNSELNKHIKILKSLENMFIVFQEQMEWVKSPESRKNTDIFNKFKTQLDEECDSLINILSDMTVKAKKIISEEENTNKAQKYELVSFIKSDSERCRKSILQVLRIISEINMKSEIESKLNMLLNWSENINEIYEEEKEDLDYSISSNIYGKTFNLCKIPTQNLEKMKLLENRVQTLAKTAITYQEVRVISILLDQYTHIVNT